MIYQIPNAESNAHTVTNRNDVSGSIWVTKNINLDKEAYIKLSPAAISFFSTEDDSNFDTADAMNVGDGKIFINSDEVFSGDVNVRTIGIQSNASDINSPSPTVEDDVVFFNGVQVVSDGSALKYEDSPGSWTSVSGLTTSTGPVSLAVFDGDSSLLRARGNKIDVINTSWVVTDTITIPLEYAVSSMVSNGSTAYIATRHDADGEAKMFLLNQGATAATESYGVESYEIASLKSYGSSVAAFTSDGRWLRFNGGGFDELAVAPVYTEDVFYGDASADYATCSNRGMVVDGNLVYTVVSTDVYDNKVRWMPYFNGGLWCFDPSVGAYHRMGQSASKIYKEANVTTASVATATDEITVTSDIPTGSPIMYDAASGAFLTPLTENRIYFVINVDANTIKLAETYTDAKAGTAIDLTGTGNDTQDFYYVSVEDYGQQMQDNSRAAVVVMTNAMYDTEHAGRIAFTGDVLNASLVEETHLNASARLFPNRGYFILPKLYAAGAEDNKFNKVSIKHLPLKTDDVITVRYRTKDKLNYPISLDYGTENYTTDIQASWTSTTTFTTTRDLSDVIAGESVEFVAGKGSGVCDTITDISEAAGTYTVTLKNGFDFAESGDLSYFMVDNWKEAGTITASSNDSDLRIDKAGEFLQLKVELNGVEITIKDILINGKTYRRLV